MMEAKSTLGFGIYLGTEDDVDTALLEKIGAVDSLSLVYGGSGGFSTYSVFAESSVQKGNWETPLKVRLDLFKQEERFLLELEPLKELKPFNVAHWLLVSYFEG